MLSRFFALYTDIYLFNRLIIILQPTGERLEWEERSTIAAFPADPTAGSRPLTALTSTVSANCLKN